MAPQRYGQLSLGLACAACLAAALLSQGGDAQVDDAEALLQGQVGAAYEEGKFLKALESGKLIQRHEKSGQKNIAEGCAMLYGCLVTNCSQPSEHCLRTPYCANGYWRCLINECGCYDAKCHAECLPKHPIPLGLQQGIEICAFTRCMR